MRCAGTQKQGQRRTHTLMRTQLHFLFFCNAFNMQSFWPPHREAKLHGSQKSPRWATLSYPISILSGSRVSGPIKCPRFSLLPNPQHPQYNHFNPAVILGCNSSCLHRARWNLLSVCFFVLERCDFSIIKKITASYLLPHKNTDTMNTERVMITRQESCNNRQTREASRTRE